MKPFRMNGKTINTTRDFSEFFSPYDLLYHKAEAAVFILNRFRYFTPATRFFADMFFKIVCTPSKAADATPESFAELICMKYQLDVYGSDAVREYFSSQDFLSDADMIFTYTENAPLDEEEKKAAFCLLTAGYRLARRHPYDEGFIPDSMKIADAMRGITGEKAPAVLEVTDSFNISIPPSTVPLEIHLDSRRAEILLNEDSSCRIVTKQLTLTPSSDPAAFTILRIFPDPYSGYEEIPLTADDSFFINFVKDIPVFVHPLYSRCYTGSVLRKGSTVTFTKGANVTSKNFPDIITALAEPEGTGYMMLRGSGLDSTYYSARGSFIFDGESAAEIYTCPKGVIWLSECGIIFSDFRSYSCTKRYASINDFITDSKEIR